MKAVRIFGATAMAAAIGLSISCTAAALAAPLTLTTAAAPARLVVLANLTIPDEAAMVFYPDLTASETIQPAIAEEAIFIRSDGSIEPPTAPIQRSGDVYSFTGDITGYAGIVVQRNNVVIDGNGHGLEGPGYGDGITVIGMYGVTVMNVKAIEGFRVGIYLSSSTGCLILDNWIIADEYGIKLSGSYYNILTGNALFGQEGSLDGMWIAGSGNTITENYIDSFGGYGLWIGSTTSDNNIYHNNFGEDNTEWAGVAPGSTNSWAFEGEGNHWEGYESQDQDGDGIWDDPYFIDDNNVDCCPLVNIYSASVGGLAELPDVSASSRPPYAALAGAAGLALVALTGGGWYVRRRWGR